MSTVLPADYREAELPTSRQRYTVVVVNPILIYSPVTPHVNKIVNAPVPDVALWGVAAIAGLVALLQQLTASRTLPRPGLLECV